MLWLAVIDRSFKLQHAAQLCIYTEVFAHFARTMAASSIHISKYKYSSRQVRIVGAQSNPTIMARRLSSMENRKPFLLISLLLFSLSLCARERVCVYGNGACPLRCRPIPLATAGAVIDPTFIIFSLSVLTSPTCVHLCRPLSIHYQFPIPY